MLYSLVYGSDIKHKSGFRTLHPETAFIMKIIFKVNYLLDLLQMFIFSASLMSSSRKSG